MYPSIKNLNIFQKYHFHTVVIVALLTFFVCVWIAFANYVTRSAFIVSVNEWFDLGKITEQQHDIVVKLIESTFFSITLVYPYLIFILVFVSYVVLFVLYTQFTVGSVHLKRAYEFSTALNRIGFYYQSDQINFAIKNKIPIYYSSEPVLSNYEVCVTAKLFPNHVYWLLPYSFIAKHIVNKSLCISKEDYDELAKNYKVAGEDRNNDEICKYKMLFAGSAAKAEQLEIQKIQLESTILSLEVKISKEIKKDTSAALSGKQAVRDASKFDYYRIAIPVADMLQNSFSGQKYTRSKIERTFFEELERQPSFKDSVVDSAVDGEGHLRLWAMDILRKRLGDMVETEGGRPAKQR